MASVLPHLISRIPPLCHLRLRLSLCAHTLLRSQRTVIKLAHSPSERERGTESIPGTARHIAGSVNIRGKLITGIIKTAKMKNTVIIRKDYLHYIKKYNRFEKRHKNTPVHVSPCFRVRPGDSILAGQCRPLSKTVRFNMLKVIRAAGGDKKAFTGM